MVLRGDKQDAWVALSSAAVTQRQPRDADCVLGLTVLHVLLVLQVLQI